MNKTLTINLSGIVFHIDENAYEVFNAYIDSVRRHFASSEGKDEIMQDIEARIAEMFQQRVEGSKQVITLRDVEEITAVMGKPEQFGDEEAGIEEEETPRPGVKRRLFRSTDDEVIGGVCSGIAAYFGIDPVWLRLAFVIGIFFGGFTVLLYIILWIVMPEAMTTTDKLMMRGEQVTISNIEKNIREEFESLKNRAGELGKEMNRKLSADYYSGFKGFIRRLFDAAGELAGFIIKVLVKIFAVFFIIIGLAVFCLLLFALIMIPGVWAIKLPPMATPGLVAALFLVGIPALLLFYHGLKRLFNIQAKSKIVNATAAGIWVIGLIIGMITAIFMIKNYSDDGSTQQELNLIQPLNDTLIVAIEDEGALFKIQDSLITIGTDDRNVDIVKSNNDKFELVKIVDAHGSSRKNAVENAAGVRIAFTQTDNRLMLSNTYQLSRDAMYAFQTVKYNIRVPEGKTIYLDKSMRRFLDDVENTGYIYDDDMAAHHWKMTSKGLACTDCTGNERTVGEHSVINEGVHIGSDDLDSVVIDKHGVIIKKDGKDVLRIDEKGMMIKAEDEKSK